jgi:hypothetical protein
MDPLKRNNIGNILLILSLVPPFVMIWFILRFNIQAPTGDEWLMVDMAREIEAGSADFNMFWRMHYVHRILFPKIIYLLIACLSGFNVFYQNMFCFLAFCLYFAILFSYLKTQTENLGISSSDRKLLCGAACLLLSLLVFSPRQHENIMWGFQVTFMTCFAASVSSLYCLSAYVGSERGKGLYIISIILAVAASFSSMQGVFTWIAGGVSMAFCGRNVFRRRSYWVWCLVGALVLLFYFLNFNDGVITIGIYVKLDNASNYLGSFIGLLVYFLSAAGSSLSPENGGALVIGFFIVYCLLYVIYELAAGKGGEPGKESVFPVSLIVYGFISVLAISFGRRLEEDALLSRYTTFSLALVIGLFLYLYGKTVGRMSVRECVVPAAAAFALFFIGKLYVRFNLTNQSETYAVLFLIPVALALIYICAGRNFAGTARGRLLCILVFLAVISTVFSSMPYHLKMIRVKAAEGQLYVFMLRNYKLSPEFSNNNLRTYTSSQMSDLLSYMEEKKYSIFRER